MAHTNADNATSTAKDVTRTLARYIVNAKPGELPAPVRDHAVRTFLNWLGCAVGSCQHEAVDIAIKTLTPFAGAEHTKKLTQRLFSIEQAKNVRGLTALLAVDKNAAIDTAVAE